MTDVRARKDLAPLFTPRSIAIVGCSPVSSGKLGSWPLRNLLLQQSPVDVYPVNPGHAEMEGLRCYPSIDALPEAPDVVLVMLPAVQSLAALEQAENAGARAAILFGAGFGEAGGGAALEDEVRRFAAASPMPICGPNTDGIINVVDGIPCGFPPFAALTPRPVGDIAVISQSGALVSSLVIRLVRSGLGLTYSCAVGNGTDLRVGDYLAHLATDERTRTMLVYAEGITDMDAFVAAADGAVANGKLVVVMKGGRTAVGAAATRSHTGSLVGSFDAFRAVCERHGVAVADNFEELTALAALAPVAARVHTGRAGIGLMSGSGAIGAFMADKAVEHGFAVPELDASTRHRLRDRFLFTEASNPIDLTGQVVHDPTLHTDCLDALCDDPGIGVIVTSSLYGPADITDRMKYELVSAAGRGATVVVYAADGNQAADEPILRAAAVPVLPSADVLFACLRKLVDVRAPRRAMGATADPARAARARSLLAASVPGEAIATSIAWELCEMYGIDVVRECVVGSGYDAVNAARRVGLPVAMKVNAASVAHRTERGLVKAGMGSDETVGAAYDALVAAIRAQQIDGASIVVQPMVADGVEMLVAVRHDAESGPVVVVGSGGIHTEIIGDPAVAAAPVDVDGAQELLERLRAKALLSGARGAAPKDIGSLARAVSNLSQLAADAGPLLAELELNPVIVHVGGAVAVDVLASR